MAAAHRRLLYAHRGASAERPENTLVAFERALEVGADALELDVHLTRDGVLIVAHDDTALRTAGVPVAWRDVDLADARRFDVGWGFLAADGRRPFAGQGLAVSTFDEILGRFPTTPLNVDLKGDSVGPALELLRRHRAEERVTVASFQARTLLAVRRRGYGGPTGLAQAEVAALLATPAAAWRSLPFTGDAAQVPVRAGPLRLDRPGFIAKCHALGLRVDYWTIDDPVEARRLLDLGADGIMTNDPGAVRAAFAG